jgi:hypothetical protein
MGIEICAMASKKLKIILFGILLAVSVLSPARGLELETRYATIIYEDMGTLRIFNKKLNMGSLKYLLYGKTSETVEDEVRNKIDLIVEKVETVLDMYPDDLKFTIEIYKSTKGVQDAHFRVYGTKVDYIAFYAPPVDTVFYAAKKTTLRVVAHEIGHVVAEKYFVVSPPVRIHEVLAQYAEKHITD